MKRCRCITIVLMIFFSLIVSSTVLKTPVISNSMDGFSATNALRHIERISRKPHSVFDLEEHEEVRQYLLETAKSYAGESNVEERNYGGKNQDANLTYVSNHDYDVDYDLRNILVSIHGKSETGILLVGHYDSRGHIGRYGELGGSYGAADDGYALGTMLEVIRLYASSNLENSIYVLFTDGEETGLYGAALEAKNKTLMDKVNFVINIEARGIKGACYMFETSSNNNRVLSLFSKANYPTTYSVATAVYTVMPNYTDFTEFLAIGKAGANFAVLDNLYYYHTPLDNYSNVDASSIQHYGAQIIPMIDEYTSDAKYADMNYFNGTHDMVFFTILPNVLIMYSELFSLILSILAILVFGIILFIKNKKEPLKLRLIGHQFAIFGILMVGIILVGFIISKYISMLNGVPWNLTYVRTSNQLTYFGIYVIIVIGAVSYYFKKYNNKKENLEYFMLGSICVNLLLAFITNLTLSGASFLFLVPAIIALGVYIVHYYIKNKYIRQVAYFINIFFILVLFTPIIYSLYLALTIGGLLALGVLIYLPLSILLPSIFLQTQE